MGNVSEHFDRSEFACKCGCGCDTVDAELLVALEDIRTHFDSPIIINSAARCNNHNRAVGGGSKSQHLYARAADIRVIGYTPDEVADYVDLCWPDEYGLGRYDSFIHVDTRTNGPARWDNRE